MTIRIATNVIGLLANKTLTRGADPVMKSRHQLASLVAHRLRNMATVALLLACGPKQPSAAPPAQGAVITGSGAQLASST